MFASLLFFDVPAFDVCVFDVPAFNIFVLDVPVFVVVLIFDVSVVVLFHRSHCCYFIFLYLSRCSFVVPCCSASRMFSDLLFFFIAFCFVFTIDVCCCFWYCSWFLLLIG